MNLVTILLSKLTEEQKITLHILSHRQVLNNESTWTQREEHHTLGSVVGGKEGQQGVKEIREG